MDNTILDLMNIQINKELTAAYLYQAIACKFAELNLNGFAHWYTVQAGEEIDHANRFIKYIKNYYTSVFDAKEAFGFSGNRFFTIIKCPKGERNKLIH